MIYVDDYTMSILKDKLKIGDKKVNVRVEVDKYDYIANQITEFYQVMLETESTSPSLNLNAETTLSDATTMRTPLNMSINDLVAYVDASPTRKFGERIHPIHKDLRMHNGIDIVTGNPATEFVPIIAVADGRIKYAKNTNGYGNMIEIEHANGISTLYAHLKSFKQDEQGTSHITSGQQIKKGDIIGEMGSTGLSTGPHLHFEVRKNNTPVDPIPYLQGEKNIQNIDNIIIHSEDNEIPSDSNLRYDFVSQTLYTSDFNNTGELVKFIQPPGNSWAISKDGDLNVLSCVNFNDSETYIAKNFNITDTALITVKYRAELSSGESFKILLGDQELHSIDSSTDGYIEYLIESSVQGANTLFLKFNKNSGTNSYIHIANIEVVNRYRKIDEKSNLIKAPDTIIINRDISSGNYIKEQPNETSSNIVELSPNDKHPFIETVYNDSDKWYKTIYASQIGYISSDLANLNTNEGLSTRVYQVPIGNYVYSKTFVLDNVKNLEMDYKYEMRAGTASFTIENIDNKYSPDYSPAKFNEYGLGFSEFKNVFIENAPVRIYIGYGDKLQRKFTGLVDNITVNGEEATMTIKCTDMMKKINDYFNYIPLSYPSGSEYETVWLASSVIHDLALIAGMNDWRTVEKDLHIPSIVIEDSYYTEIRPTNGTFVKINEKNEFNIVEMTSLPDGIGYKNPAIWTGHLQVGTNFGEYIENICKQLGYWHRCDYYGTYYATKIPYLMNDAESIKGLSVFKFRDNDNIVSINKSYDYSKIRNHLIISGPLSQDHFFDIELWKFTRGIRKTASEYFDFADTYGKRNEIAKKMFYDMKCLSNTLQTAVEGNPYIELMDIVEIENKNTNTKDCYIVKGIKDSYTEEQGYITSLDLFWV